MSFLKYNFVSPEIDNKCSQSKSIQKKVKTGLTVILKVSIQSPPFDSVVIPVPKIVKLSKSSRSQQISGKYNYKKVYVRFRKKLKQNRAHLRRFFQPKISKTFKYSCLK